MKKAKCSVIQKFILLPQGVNVDKSDFLACPDSCPYKKGQCQEKTKFEVTAVREGATTDTDVLCYSGAELQQLWGSTYDGGVASAKRDDSSSSQKVEDTQRQGFFTPRAKSIFESQARQSTQQSTNQTTQQTTNQTTQQTTSQTTPQKSNQTFEGNSSGKNQNQSSGQKAGGFVPRPVTSDRNTPEKPIEEEGRIVFGGKERKKEDNVFGYVPSYEEVKAQTEEPLLPIFVRAEKKKRETPPAEDKSGEGNVVKKSRAETLAKYGSRNLTTNTENASEERKESFEGEYYEIPRDLRDITSLTINGVTYTTESIGRYGVRDMSEAMRDVFAHWNTEFVFAKEDCTALKSEFEWLIAYTFPHKIRREKIKKILTDYGKSRSEKFFAIFYKVLYCDNPPQSFYFSKSRRENRTLPAWFSTKEEFAKLFCSGEQPILNLYEEERGLILDYLRIKEEDFRKQIVLSRAAENKIVLFDIGGKVALDICTVNEFFHCLISPDMDAMRERIAFLKDYEIVGGKVVERKSSGISLVDMVGKAENNLVFDRLGVSSEQKATEYQYFLTLLKEYLEKMHPEKVIIGQAFSLTRRGFASEIKEIVKKFCATRLGTARVGESEFNRGVGNGFLLKSLIDHKVLEEYFDNCENRAELLALLGLVKEDVSLKEYFNLFGEDADFLIGNKYITIPDLIRQYVNSDNNIISKIASIRNDTRINTFLEMQDSKNAKGQKDLEKLIDGYETLFKS